MVARRGFLIGVAGLLGGPLAYHSWFRRNPNLKGRICGASSSFAHQMRQAISLTPQTEERFQVAIVGGGIAGLSAAWWLKKQGLTDFVLLELEERAGGNSSWGENEVSPYPWGAHYVPVPNQESVLVRELFEELGVIEGYDNGGKPRFNELYLCAGPLERLYIHGRWQEGLIPLIGTSSSDRAQFSAFFDAMNEFRNAHGADGLEAFAIPLEQSSLDARFIKLDAFSMAQFMDEKGWNSPYLRWYVDYSCRDDYGVSSADVSAWAGIHYFAGRRGFAANAEDGQVLTWPEGNGWIVKQLVARFPDKIRSGSLVYRCEEQSDEVALDYMERATNTPHRVRAKYVIYAAPRFTAPYVLGSKPLTDFHYAPWLVANLTLKNLPANSPKGFAWDNVMYGSNSLGYVHANHQSLARYSGKSVLTYYHPLDHVAPSEARTWAQGLTWDQWSEYVLNDLERAHRDIRDLTQHVDIWLWGHGMIRPEPGFIWGASRVEAKRELNRIFFAHSDMSGISIFEEAQYRGVEAARGVLRNG